MFTGLPSSCCPKMCVKVLWVYCCSSMSQILNLFIYFVLLSIFCNLILLQQALILRTKKKKSVHSPTRAKQKQDGACQFPSFVSVRLVSARRCPFGHDSRMYQGRGTVFFFILYSWLLLSCLFFVVWFHSCVRGSGGNIRSMIQRNREEESGEEVWGGSLTRNRYFFSFL